MDDPMNAQLKMKACVTGVDSRMFVEFTNVGFQPGQISRKCLARRGLGSGQGQRLQLKT